MKRTLTTTLSLLSVATLLALAGCPPEDEDTPDTITAGAAADATPEVTPDVAPDSTTGTLQWYTTCGDPVCGGYTPPNPALPMCSDLGVSADQACTQDGQQCDPMSDCNATLICADSDPTAGPVGCPKSRAAFKTDVSYVTDEDRKSLARELLKMPLARWRYLHEGAETPAHLGFIIEDIEPSHAVQSRRDRVDLYGYTTMAVATIQEQQRRIEALEKQVDGLRKDLRSAIDALKKAR